VERLKDAVRTLRRSVLAVASFNSYHRKKEDKEKKTHGHLLAVKVFHGNN
jgi:hypothetical protein